MIPLVLSDQKAVICRANLTPQINHAPRWCFNTSFLQDINFINQFQSALAEFISFNEHSVDDPRGLWDAKVLLEVTVLHLHPI